MLAQLHVEAPAIRRAATLYFYLCLAFPRTPRTMPRHCRLRMQVSLKFAAFEDSSPRLGTFAPRAAGLQGYAMMISISPRLSCRASRLAAPPPIYLITCGEVDEASLIGVLMLSKLISSASINYFSYVMPRLKLFIY